MIGTLQRNKVKHLVPFIYCIHSVDNFKLLEEIEKEAAKFNRKVSCLMQIHIATEETKHGFSLDEIETFFKSGAWKNFNHIIFSGLMGMATLTDDEKQIHTEFEGLKSLFDEVLTHANPDEFQELSMGMSSDFAIALAHGATLVRIGSSIFGQRI
jgi:pyridoxal phosphate enzyme (YggS family)